DESFERNIEFIEKSDAVILSNLIVGKGNLRNLEAALYAAKLGKLFVVEEEDFNKRNFAGDEALKIYNEISSKISSERKIKSNQVISALSFI
ncbi:hypothetical protein DRP07_09865, partial [Archaeoglobales archaeon]